MLRWNREAGKDPGQGDALQGGEDNVSRAHPRIRTQPESPEAAGQGRLYARSRVLHHDGLLRHYAQLPRAMQKEVRGRLGPLHAIAVGDGVGQRPEVQAVQDGAGVLTGRGDAHLQSGLAEFLQEFQRTGEEIAGGEGFQGLSVVAVLALHPLRHLFLGGGAAIQEEFQRAAAGDAT